MVQDVTVKVSKEAYELGEGLKKFVLSIKGALADGWQPGQDIPVVLTAALSDLVPAVQGVEKVKEEVKEDLEAFVSALVLPAKEMAFALAK